MLIAGLCVLSALTLGACGGGGGNANSGPTQAAGTGTLRVSIPVEDRARNLTGGALLVTSRLDGGAEQSMVLNGGLAEIDISGVPVGTRSIDVAITYQHDEFGPIELATLQRNVNVEAGINRLDIQQTDFDLSLFDADADGTSNIDELVAGRDPEDVCDGAGGSFWGNLRWGRGVWSAKSGTASDQCF